jgi:L-ascorbate metabolism protein UlaG (beta-lactamase superfamily)
MQMILRWLGNAGFEFRLGKTTMLVDPFLTRPKQSRVYLGRVAVDSKSIDEHIKDCSHILVSHAHFDHFMDVPEIAICTDAIIHGAANTCELARRLNVPENRIHQISANDEFDFDGIKVKAIPAVHPWIPGFTSGKVKINLKQPLRLREYRMDTCLSFLISSQGRHILLWSSIETENAATADVLICRAVSNEQWYARIMEAVQPRLVIPSHWDDLFRPLSDPIRPFFSPPRLALPPLSRIDLGEFELKVKKAKPDCEVLVPERFKEYQIWQ